MKFLNGIRSTSIKIVKQWQADSRFFAPGVLINVINGKGILRGVYGEVEEPQAVYSACVLGDKPLLQLHSEDEYFCPTCEKIVRSGYGMGETERLEILGSNRINEENVSLIEAVEGMEPMLKLLSSGLYVIVDTKLHPVDGNGCFFWEQPKPVAAKGSCIYYLGDGEWGSQRPYFTVATQPAAKCCRERVEYYMSNPVGRAVAYYMDGYLTALLDGHHKTFAAALRHEDVDALVIMPVFCAWKRSQNQDEKEVCGISCGELSFTAQELRIASARLEQLTVKEQHLSGLESKKIWDSFCLGASTQPTLPFPFETDGLATYYPTADIQAKLELTGPLDDLRLNCILSGERICPEDEICTVMEAMEGMRHPRTEELGMFFSCQEHCKETLYHVLETLTRLPRSEELEQFLIDRMVELEGEYPEIGKMILKSL